MKTLLLLALTLMALTATATATAWDSLPLVELPAAGTGDTFAVIVSGDGGWASIDKQVGEALASKGIPVVGLNALSYFWQRRTPEGFAQDIAAIVTHYARKWGKSRVMLVGYSFGADTLPFAVTRLPTQVAERVALVALLAPAPRAHFEFHVGDWLGLDAAEGLDVRAEIRRIDGPPVLCVYGEDEKGTACPGLASASVTIIALPGGHHFGGDYGAVTNAIRGSLR